MPKKKMALFGAAASIALCAMQASTALAAEAETAVGPTAVTEVIVTAQKRQENIQNVGMSIQAATGARLVQMGVKNTADLQKIVPGFQATATDRGTTVFSIRGVGFQDPSLAGSPTVSVYLDEMPLPFSALTNGASLDLQRVEVLKGPQGTLFGNNATGGAINYIANKPTDTFQAGADLSYGTFNDTDLSGYVSGPIADGLDARLALSHEESGAWQKSYGPQPSESQGGKDFTNGRFSVQWKPNDRFKALLTLNGWQDKGWNQAGQLFGIGELSQVAPLDPLIANFPAAPHNDQAADWNSCVNDSIYNPIANQAKGTQVATISNPGPNATPTGPLVSEGAGSVAWAGGQPTSCEPARRNNSYYDGSLRLDYDLGHNMTLTSLTEYQKFNENSPVDGTGMDLQDYQLLERGKIQSTYQEVRLAGKWWDGKGNWVIGANYENDKTWDSFFQSVAADSLAPTVILNPNFFGVGTFPVVLGQVQPVTSACGVAGTLGPTAGLGCGTANTAIVTGTGKGVDAQLTNTYAVFASGEYPILDNLSLLGGVRFTQENKTGGVCLLDSGDGTGSELLYVLEQFYNPPSSDPIASPPGGCVSTSLTDPYNPPDGGRSLYYSHLNQNNVAWRVGLNWKVDPETLLYVNISQGYKGGSYPTVPSVSLDQIRPVVQEGLLSYEVGFKSELFDHQLQLNGAAFYYDYTNKQVQGDVADPVYGGLPTLINVPKSDVKGFELSGVYRPDWFRGLTITPALTYQYSEVDKSSVNSCAPPANQNPAISGVAPTAEGTNDKLLGTSPNVPGQIYCKAGEFYGYDAFGEYGDFTGEKFPNAPVWQANFDAEYDWKIHDDIGAFVGLNYAYVSGTNSFFYNRNPIPAYLNIGPNSVNPYFGGYETCSGAISATPVGPCPTNHANNPLTIPGYGLLDLRAGVSSGDWLFELWGRNVTNQWYWTSATHSADALVHYTGMPATVGFTLSYRYH